MQSDRKFRCHVIDPYVNDYQFFDNKFVLYHKSRKMKTDNTGFINKIFQRVPLIVKKKKVYKCFNCFNKLLIQFIINAF